MQNSNDKTQENKSTDQASEIAALKARLEFLEMEKKYLEMKKKIGDSEPPKELRPRVVKPNPQSKPASMPRVPLQPRQSSEQAQNVSASPAVKRPIRSSEISSSPESKRPHIVDKSATVEFSNTRVSPIVAVKKKRSKLLIGIVILFLLVVFAGAVMFARSFILQPEQFYKQISEQLGKFSKETTFTWEKVPYRGSFSDGDLGETTVEQDYLNLENYLTINPSFVIKNKKLEENKPLRSSIYALLVWQLSNPNYNLRFENARYKDMFIDKFSMRKNIIDKNYHTKLVITTKDSEKYDIDFDFLLSGKDILLKKFSVKIDGKLIKMADELSFKIKFTEGIWANDGTVKSTMGVKSFIKNNLVDLEMASDSFDWGYHSGDGIALLKNDIKGKIAKVKVQGAISNINIDSLINIGDIKDFNLSYKDLMTVFSSRQLLINSSRLFSDDIKMVSKNFGNGIISNFKYTQEVFTGKLSSLELDLASLMAVFGEKFPISEKINFDGEFEFQEGSYKLQNTKILAKKNNINNANFDFTDKHRSVSLKEGVIDLDSWDFNFEQKDLLIYLKNLIPYFKTSKDIYFLNLESQAELIFMQQIFSGGRIDLEQDGNNLTINKFYLGDTKKFIDLKGNLTNEQWSLKVNSKGINIRPILKKETEKLDIKAITSFDGVITGELSNGNLSEISHIKNMDLNGKLKLDNLEVSGLDFGKNICAVLANSGDATMNSSQVASENSIVADISIVDDYLSSKLEGNIDTIGVSGTLNYDFDADKSSFDGAVRVPKETEKCILPTEALKIYLTCSAEGGSFRENCILNYNSGNVLDKTTFTKSNIKIKQESRKETKPKAPPPKSKQAETTFSKEELDKLISEEFNSSSSKNTIKTTKSSKKQEQKKTSRTNQSYIPQ